MKIIRVIPALPKENKKLRVAAYCRVSTSNKAQLRSLDIQIETYTKMIRSNKDYKVQKIEVYDEYILIRGCEGLNITAHLK